MFYQFKSYFRFLIKSTNHHGVHSPFVYHLVTNCFYADVNPDKHQKITDYRTHLLQNNNTILVSDFGKGSRIFKSNNREIAKIAKIAGISKKRANLLIKVTEYFNATTILEIGTSLGIGTASLHLGNNKSTITTLEGCNNTANIAKNMFDQFHFKNIRIRIGDFKDTLKTTLKNTKYDLIYFDGNHQKQPTIDYFEQCLQATHNNSVFIFDDIHWSKEMEQAWNYIKNHEKVTVSIDTYFWGFVFFRKEQKKEHFTIRV